MEPGSRKHPIKYLNWLSDENLWNPEALAGRKTAIVAKMELAYAVADFEDLGATEVTSIGGYTIYELANPAALAEDLA